MALRSYNLALHYVFGGQTASSLQPYERNAQIICIGNLLTRCFHFFLFFLTLVLVCFIENSISSSHIKMLHFSASLYVFLKPFVTNWTGPQVIGVNQCNNLWFFSWNITSYSKMVSCRWVVPNTLRFGAMDVVVDSNPLCSIPISPSFFFLFFFKIVKFLNLPCKCPFFSLFK